MTIRIHRAILAIAPALFSTAMGACSSDDTSRIQGPEADARADVAPGDAATDAGDGGDAADGGEGGDAADGGEGGDAADGGEGGAGAPHVVSSDPAEGATDVYPVEVYDQGSGRGVGERKRISVRFDAPMDTTVVRAELASAGAMRSLEGVWASDALGIEFTVLPPEPENPDSHPLEARTAYRLDLRGLRDATGRSLDASHASLGDGVLDFQTGDADPLLNHACQHTLFGPYTSVTATPLAAEGPSTNSTHREYTVTLPSSGEGFTRLRFSSGSSRQVEYIFYLDRPVPVQIQDETKGQPIALSSSGTTPPACPGIRNFVRFSTERTDQHHAKFGPISGSSFKFIIEAL